MIIQCVFGWLVGFKRINKVWKSKGLKRKLLLSWVLPSVGSLKFDGCVMGIPRVIRNMRADQRSMVLWLELFQNQQEKV